jgi:hypothetical protein
LYGEDILKEFNGDKTFSRFAKGRVSFTHFINLTYEPEKITLEKLLRRCAAAVMKRGQKGSDLLIPVVLEDSTLSFIIVQVINVFMLFFLLKKKKGKKLDRRDTK